MTAAQIRKYSSRARRRRLCRRLVLAALLLGAVLLLVDRKFKPIELSLGEGRSAATGSSTRS